MTTHGWMMDDDNCSSPFPTPPYHPTTPFTHTSIRITNDFLLLLFFTYYYYYYLLLLFIIIIYYLYLYFDVNSYLISLFQ